MGIEWLKYYVLKDANRKSYLYPDFSTEDGKKYYTIDVYTLADLLFNLQDVEGFDDCLEPMIGGGIPAVMSELLCGMMLRQSGYRFRFVKRSDRKTFDYDIELAYADGTEACLEVKSKGKNTVRPLGQSMTHLSRLAGATAG